MKFNYDKLDWMNSLVNRFDNELFDWFGGLPDEDFDKLRRAPFPELARLVARHAEKNAVDDDTEFPEAEM